MTLGVTALTSAMRNVCRKLLLLFVLRMLTPPAGTSLLMALVLAMSLVPA